MRRPLALLLLGLVPANALADPGLTPEFRAFLESAGERTAIAAFAQAIVDRQTQTCETATRPVAVDPTYSLSRGSAPSFGADGRPRAGWWIARVPATICGASVRINIQNQADAAGAIQRVALVNGTSRIAPAQQAAALREALAAAGPVIPETCDAPRVRTTFGPETPSAGPWTETWIIDACSSPIRVSVSVAGPGRDDPPGAVLIDPLPQHGALAVPPEIMRPAGSRRPGGYAPFGTAAAALIPNAHSTVAAAIGAAQANEARAVRQTLAALHRPVPTRAPVYTPTYVTRTVVVRTYRIVPVRVVRR